MPLDKTSLSMLDGIRRNEPAQWGRFVSLFGPLVYEWCRRGQVPEHDAADIVQEVFKVVAEKIRDFRREQSGDSFHGWLYGITRIKCLDHFRQRAKQGMAIGGSAAQQMLQQEAGKEFPADDELHAVVENATLFRRALRLLQTEFEPKTWQAFWRITIDGVKPSELSQELGMTTGAIYNAKYKVLRRLRTEFDGLISIPEAS